MKLGVSCKEAFMKLGVSCKEAFLKLGVSCKEAFEVKGENGNGIGNGQLRAETAGKINKLKNAANR